MVPTGSPASLAKALACPRRLCGEAVDIAPPAAADRATRGTPRPKQPPALHPQRDPAPPSFPPAAPLRPIRPRETADDLRSVRARPQLPDNVVAHHRSRGCRARGTMAPRTLARNSWDLPVLRGESRAPTWLMQCASTATSGHPNLWIRSRNPGNGRRSGRRRQAILPARSRPPLHHFIVGKSGGQIVAGIPRAARASHWVVHEGDQGEMTRVVPGASSRGR